ncbi:MAG: SGNH/GDSL hydrolase family protein [Sedimentisphaeraceae bacterium JB056]
MKQKTVMCFGDSNTWGYPPDGSERYERSVRWPGVLQSELGEDFYVIEEGLCGRNTVWDDPIEGHKNGLKQLVPLLHTHAPLDLIVIMLGTNDLKNRFSVSALDIAWSVGRLVDTVKKSQIAYTGDVPQVLVVCPPPLADMSKSPFKDILIGAEEKSKQLSETFKAYCCENDIEMLDAGKVVVTSDVDGVHLDPEEHKKLGTAVAKKVREILL